MLFISEERRRSEELNRMAVIAIPPIPPPSDLYSLPAMPMIISVRGPIKKYYLYAHNPFFPFPFTQDDDDDDDIFDQTDEIQASTSLKVDDFAL